MRPLAPGHSSGSPCPSSNINFKNTASSSSETATSSLESSSSIAIAMIHPGEVETTNSPSSSPSTAWPTNNSSLRYHCWPYGITGGVAPVTSTWHALASRFTESNSNFNSNFNLHPTWTQRCMQPLVRATSQITGET